MAAPSSPSAIREVNTRYHDAAAGDYDDKWGIDFGPVGESQVLGKLRKLLGHELPVFEHVLEVGAGTGYFSLNLLRAGVARRATCTDISPGMLRRLRANADRLALNGAVATRACDAEALPFAAGAFDLVLGHAVLHHLPDLDRAFAEFHRVLAPGGHVAFAGEPSQLGDRLAGVPKRAATRAAPLWRGALRIEAGGGPGGAGGPSADHELERFVDVHTFGPDELAAHARRAGFADVRVRGEELLANWFGWANRTLEATADPRTVPWLWTQYAYRGYLLLQAVDAKLLEPRLPPALFYNLMLCGRR